MADLQGDRSYLLVFAAEDRRTYEVYLPGAGWPGDFTGFMTPSLRQQESGETSELTWENAEKLADQLRPLLVPASIARGGIVRASECVEALANGRRYGHVASEA
jgi:hypothetical protein